MLYYTKNILSFWCIRYIVIFNGVIFSLKLYLLVKTIHFKGKK